MGLIKEFKDFAMRGNVVDMAVGIIIGASFGKIVSSLVNDMIMPVIGKLVGGVNFSELSYSLGKIPAVLGEDGKVITDAKEATIHYGQFIQTVFDFLIVAFAIFMMIKFMNKAQDAAAKAAGFEEEVEEKAEPTPPEDVLLLREIRDSLKNS